MVKTLWDLNFDENVPNGPQRSVKREDNTTTRENDNDDASTAAGAESSAMSTVQKSASIGAPAQRVEKNLDAESKAQHEQRRYGETVDHLFGGDYFERNSLYHSILVPQLREQNKSIAKRKDTSVSTAARGETSEKTSVGSPEVDKEDGNRPKKPKPISLPQEVPQDQFWGEYKTQRNSHNTPNQESSSKTSSSATSQGGAATASAESDDGDDWRTRANLYLNNPEGTKDELSDAERREWNRRIALANTFGEINDVMEDERIADLKAAGYYDPPPADHPYHNTAGRPQLMDDPHGRVFADEAEDYYNQWDGDWDKEPWWGATFQTQLINRKEQLSSSHSPERESSPWEVTGIAGRRCLYTRPESNCEVHRVSLPPGAPYDPFLNHERDGRPPPEDSHARAVREAAELDARKEKRRKLFEQIGGGEHRKLASDDRDSAAADGDTGGVETDLDEAGHNQYGGKVAGRGVDRDTNVPSSRTRHFMGISSSLSLLAHSWSAHHVLGTEHPTGWIRLEPTVGVIGATALLMMAPLIALALMVIRTQRRRHYR